MIRVKKNTLMILMLIMLVNSVLLISIIIKNGIETSNKIERLEIWIYSNKVESLIIKQPISYVADRLNKSAINIETIKKEDELAQSELIETPKGELLGDFIATGYNLSVESCGKSKKHPTYGITASGYSLVGHTRESTMTIATDPKVIPLGSEVYLEFGEGYEHLNGIYTSRDKGGMIKGNKIDVFMGEDMSNKDVYKLIGKQEIKVYMIGDINK